MKGLHLDRYQALAGAQLGATSLKASPVHRPRRQYCGHYSLAAARQDGLRPHLLIMIGLISSDTFLPVWHSRFRSTSLAGFFVLIACKMLQASSIQRLLVLFSCALAANAASVPLSHRQAANLTVATQLQTNWTYVGCYRCVREYVVDDHFL